MRKSGQIKSVEQAIQADSISVGSIHRVHGKEFSEGVIMGWLNYLNDVLNLNKPLSDDQIELCATEIVNEYFNLQFSDLTLLFRKIISGEYGEFYEALSIPKVLTFFRTYYEERLNVAYHVNLKKHEDQRSMEEFNISKNIKRIWRGTPSK